MNRIAWPTLAALIAELGLCALTVGLAVWAWSPWVVIPAMFVIATRQHALFILYHDAVHGLLARPMRLNDALIDLLAGVPMLLPVHVYRSLHLVHHRTLGTDADPERLLLYVGQDWRYGPLPARLLLRQVLFDTLLINQLKTGFAYVRERWVTGRLKLPPSRPWPELALIFALVWGPFAGLCWVAPELALRIGIVWFVPLLTLTQGIQKVRSFAEHNATGELSGSWAPGLLGRLVLWPYHIDFHREHHSRPSVPWYRLPAEFGDRVARPGRDLIGHVWDGRI